MTEIRSFRRVFDLERRIYSIDRFRLNPSGVPVRGVVYFLALLGVFAVIGRLPPLSAAHWYLRQLAAPGAVATLLALIRIDGRTFHHAARAYLRLLAMPRRTTGLRRGSTSWRRWRVEELLFLPDGSEHRLRAFRYTGPGAVLVRVPHRLSRGAPRRRALPGVAAPELELTPEDRPRRPGEARIISLGAGTRLQVRDAGPR